jgi:hypothetical protein
MDPFFSFFLFFFFKKKNLLNSETKMRRVNHDKPRGTVHHKNEVISNLVADIENSFVLFVPLCPI